MTRDAVLRKLSGFSTPAPKILVEDQDVSDIIDGTIRKHVECTKYYDVLFPMFDQEGSWKQVCRRLFDFCREQIAYEVESTDWQWVSTPMTIMKKGYCDCKGYALFCAGVIDAMKRAGEKVDWCYRFASYSLFSSTPHHVFVVVNPDTDNIWLDPVLETFNSKMPRPFWKVDKRVKTCRSFEVAGIGYIPGAGPLMDSIGSQEQSLLDSIDEYAEGVSGAIQFAKASGTLNTICVAVIATASVAIPVIALAMGVIKLASTVVSNNFGPGSVAARLLQDVASNPLTAPVTIVESLIKGRTFESDQYRAAQFHQFYVLGNARVNALNKVADNMIPDALKWFIDRLGVFISGAEHIVALTQSPAAYMALYGVNHYTTMDANRVNAAYNVAQKYFVFNSIAGSWAETVGVYDLLIASIAQQQNETVESAARQAGYRGVFSSDATSGPAPVDNSGSGSLGGLMVPAILIGGALVLLSTSNRKYGS